MDALERRYIDSLHCEANAIERQRLASGPGVTLQHIIDLNRFCDCCDDGEGYDVPKERMRALREAGLLSGGRFGYYTTTPEGQRILSWRFDK